MNQLRKTIADSAAARWTILVLVSLTMMCGYFLTDTIGPLKSLLENTLEWNSSDFGTFNSGYGWLNVNLFLLIIGGVILDRKGARFTGIFSIAIMVLGACIKYYAFAIMPVDVTATTFGIKDQVLVSALGYAVFAFGYETMNITCTKLIVRWFTGREMALALGMNVAFARLGTMLAMGAPLRLYEWSHSISTPFLFGLIMLIFGLLTFIVVILMDKKLDSQCAINSASDPSEKFELRDIFSIVKMKAFWYIAILCLVFYIAVMTFQKFGVQFIGMKFGLSEVSAGDIMMVLPVGALFLTPLFGGVYDKKGKGATMMLIGCLMIIAVYALFAIPSLTNTFALYAIVILLGISFSLVPSAMWPSVAKIIPEQKLGTAYALIFWVQNIGLAYAPLVIGIVLDKYCVTGSVEGAVQYDYTLPMLIFMGLGIVALLFAYALKAENRKRGYGLEEKNIK